MALKDAVRTVGHTQADQMEESLALFGCLIALLLAVAPRTLLVLAWVVADKWVQVWDGAVAVPLLGIALMPYTTIMYVLVWTPDGFAGFAWMWLALGLLLDASTWSLGVVFRRADSDSAAGAARFWLRVGIDSAAGAVRGLRRLARETVYLVRSTPWFVWVIFLGALVLRLAGVGFALPQQLDPDEPWFIDGALRMVADGGWDPGFYSHPASTLMGGMAAMFGAYGVAGVLTGTFSSVGDIVSSYQSDGSHFMAIGRVYTALAGSVVVLLTYAIGRQLRISVFWSTVATAMLAVSPLMISYSWLVRADMHMIAFVMLAMLTTLRAMARPTRSRFVLAGIFLGLAVASKYPGVIAVLPIIAAAVLATARRRITATEAFGYLLGAAVASLLTVLMVAPYLFLNFTAVLDQVLFEAQPTHLSHTGQGFLPDLWRYLTVALPQALAVPGTVLGIAGVVAAIFVRRAWPVALFFWVFLAFISVLSTWWVRWMLPLVPMAAIGAALLVDRIEARSGSRSRRNWMYLARLVVAGLLLLPLLQPTALQVSARWANNDPRVEALSWVESNVPAGATLVVESYTPQVSTEDYELLIARDGQLIPWQDYSDQVRPASFFGSIAGGWGEHPAEDFIEEVEAQDVDYLLLSGSWINRYGAEREAYPREWAFYQALLDVYPAVRTFGRDDVIVLDAGGG